MAVIDCLEDPDETLKLKTLELLVTMTKANNVQVRAPSLPSNMEVMVIITYTSVHCVAGGVCQVAD
jgi:hypothetical protein